MKKIAITICGILIAGNAVCRDVQVPKKTNVEPWWNTETSYGTSITNFYPAVANEIADSRYDTRHGTWRDEGAIVIWAARDIYAHGAKFCPVSIQAANANKKINDERVVWLDYYWDTNNTKWNNCATVCENGYHGDTCQHTGYGNCPSEETTQQNTGKLFVDLFGRIKKALNTITEKHYLGILPEWHTLCEGMSGIYNKVVCRKETGDKHRHTTKMTVISYENGYGSDNRDATHVVLGVVGSVDYGIKVAPIRIVGHRSGTGGGIKSWIQSAESNGNGILICYEGYQPDNGKCVIASSCTNSGDSENSDIPNGTTWCSGWSEHNNYSIFKDVLVGDCKEYRCKDEDKGLSSDKTRCISCSQGVSNGFCCGENQIFVESVNRCVTLQKYTHRDMQHGSGHNSENSSNCWLKTDLDDFKECVKR